MSVTDPQPPLTFRPFGTIATSTPSPPWNGPSPRSATSSKSSPGSSASTGTTRLRAILPRPSGPTTSTATTTASTLGAAGPSGKMDKTPWRTGTGSKKGPFTVDSGGGKAGTTRKTVAQPAAGPSRSGTGMSKGSNQFQRPAAPSRPQQQLLHQLQSQQMPQQYPSAAQQMSTQFSPSTSQFPSLHQHQQQQQFLPQQPPNPMSMPQHNRQNSYHHDPYSSISTTPNPQTPLDMPQFGSAPLTSPFASFSQGSQGFAQQGMQNMSTTPLEAPTSSPWAGSLPSQSAAQSPIDWTSPSMAWLFPPGQTAGPEEAEQNLLNSLAGMIHEDALSKEPSPQDIDAMLQSAFDATRVQTPPSIPPAQTPPIMAQQSSLLSRQMQQQQQQQGFAGSLPQTSRSYTPGPAVPTPPQNFASSFGNAKPSMSMWPLTDRGNVYNETPVTTPGGSDLGFGTSPAEPPSASRMQPPPNRRTAPQPSNPFPSFTTSPPTVPPPNPLSAGQTPPNWPAGMSLSGLPPLPPGLSISHLAQYGQFGLEMAIRMGMGIGMGLGQHAAQQQENSQPSSSNQSPVAPAPAPAKKRSGNSRPQPVPASRRPSVEPTAAPDPRAKVVSNILNDDFFAARSPMSPGSATLPTMLDIHPPSRGGAGSPEPALTSPVNEVADPLATQVWKAYAKAKDGLPNGPRMENLTWRLMHLTLKKQEEEQGASGMSKSAGTSRGFQAGSLDTVREEKSGNSPAAQEEHGSRESSGEFERGRSKGKSRVVGFHNAASPQDAPADDGGMDWRMASRSRSRIQQDWRMTSRSRSRSVAPRSSAFGSGSEQRALDLLSHGPMLNGSFGQSMPPPVTNWQSSGLAGVPSSGPADYNPASFPDNFTDFNLLNDPNVGLHDNAFDPLANSLPQDPNGLAQLSAMLGSPTKSGWAPNLPGIAGPGLYTQTEENYHPQFGFLPRRVRKTSFDHTIYQSPENASRMLPPSDTNPRKRQAEASPRDGINAPLPDENGFPSSNFTFSFPQSLDNMFDLSAVSTHPTPEGTEWFSQSQPITADTSAYNSPSAGPFGMDPRVLAPQQAQSQSVGTGEDPYDFQQLMSMYLTNSSASPFTHVNPAQVLGMGDGGLAESGLSGSSGEQLGISAPSASGSYVHQSQSPQVRQKPPTKPVPKTVGGKPVASASASTSVPAPPARSNSSPNLQALRMQGMSTASATASSSSRPTTSKGGGGHSKQSSVAAPTKKASKSGTATPATEGGAKAGDILKQPAGNGDGPIFCSNCLTVNTPLWRRDEDGNAACNACGLFRKLHGVVRPLSLKTDVIKKRNRAGPAAKESSAKKAGINASTNSSKSNKIIHSSQSKPASPSAAAAVAITKKQRRVSDGRGGSAGDGGFSGPGSAGSTSGRNGFQAQAGLSMSSK